MMVRKLTTRTAVVGGMVAALLVGGSSVLALAAGDDTDEVIHACVNSQGKLTIVDADATCGTNETKISWNKHGPPGPPGSGFIDVQHLVQTVNVLAGQSVSATITCPPGMVAIGGGFNLGSLDLRVTGSLSTNASNWRTDFVNTGSVDAVAVARAVCLNEILV